MASPHPGPLHTPATNRNRIGIASQRRFRRSGKRVLILLPLLACCPDISSGRTQIPNSAPLGSTRSVAMDRESSKPKLSDKVVVSNPRGVDQKGQPNRTNEQVILAFQSRDERESHRAVEEVLSRGDRMIPLLMQLRGDSRKFSGYGLGDPMTASYIYTTIAGQKQPKGSVITVEVAAMYLISAIYHESLAFARAPYLTDGSYVKDLNYNTDECVRMAWDSVEQWSQSLRQEGLVSLRAKGQEPLGGSLVRFWGSNVIDHAQSQEPMVVRASSAVFPLIAALAEESGTVVVEVKIKPDGTVAEANVVDGHRLFLVAAKASSRQWVFNSVTGPNVFRTARLTFDFKLIRRESRPEELSPVFIPPYAVEIRATVPADDLTKSEDPP